MKKLLTFAFALSLVTLAFTSCNDDNSLPDVDYDVTFSGASFDAQTSTLTVMQGDTLRIDSIGITNNESDKTAVITGAQYYWDYNFVGVSPFPPYRFAIPTDSKTPLGNHELTIQMLVLAVDKEPATGVISYNVVVVPDTTAATLE